MGTFKEKNNNEKDDAVERISAACGIMRENLEHPKSIKAIAQAVGASEFHFYRIFKEVTKSTPHAYYMAIRLTHAAQLLQTTNLSIGNIAYQTGFTDVSAFSRAFGKTYQQSPSQFRCAKRA